MTTKKDKLLESAQKFIAKGQTDRAIKDYEQIVALDSKDIRSRQRYAELLVRANRKADAIAEYENIGKFYVESTHYLKAIAVYKQIQKLEPGNIQTALTLAALNEKQGLPGNALSEYDQILAMYQKEAQWTEALKVIEKMLAVDPENLNTRLKQAELEFSANQPDKSYTNFIKLLVTLQKRQETSAYKQISDRVRTLFPARGEFEADLAGVLIEEGNAAEALAQLKECLKKNGNSLKTWHLVASAQKTLGEHEECRMTYMQMLRLFPAELSIIESLVPFCMSQGDLEGAVSLLTTSSERFISAGAASSLEKLYNNLLVLSPLDLRILDGLRKVYTSTGEKPKLHIIEGKINSLAPGGQTTAPPPAEATPPSANTPAPPEEDLAPADDIADLELEDLPEFADETSVADSSEIAVPDLPAEIPETESVTEWEEDLDLSFLDDVSGDEPSLLLPDSHDVETQQQELEAGEASHLPMQDLQNDDSPVGTEAEPAPLSVSALEDHDTDESFTENNEMPIELDLDFTYLADSAIPVDFSSQAPITDFSPQHPDSAHGEPKEPELLLDLEEIEELAPEQDDHGVPSPGAASAAFAPQPLVDDTSDEFLSSGSAISLGERPDEEDPETHYNLGIAYKEMGLYDEAVQELRKAQKYSSYRFSCITLEALCYRDKGELEKAEGVYLRGIEQTEEGGTERVSLLHELGFLYEICGRTDEAIILYNTVLELDPLFPDVANKIAALQGGETAIELDDSEIMELDHDDFV